MNGLYAPDQGPFPQYAGGKYTVGDSTMIVSRGLAKESTRVPRIFNRPEVVMVDINRLNGKLSNMKIVTDMSIKKKYWQDKFKNAYPQKSFSDPDFCVLKFVPESGRFYSWFKPEDFDIS